MITSRYFSRNALSINAPSIIAPSIIAPSNIDGLLTLSKCMITVHNKGILRRDR